MPSKGSDQTAFAKSDQSWLGALGIAKNPRLCKASGPDGISNRILKELSHELSSPYCSLFNQSLRSGIFSSPYKDANVSPVPKKGDLSVVSNYRPISLLNS